MAWTLDAKSQGVVSVDELLDAAAAAIPDPTDLDAIAGVAPLLQGLAQDRTLVSDAINGELAHILGGRGRLFYSQQSLVLKQVDRRFTVRANIWPLVKSKPRSRPITEKVFAYSVPHDHNFTFLTVGYQGPGYETSIYEYEFARVQGYVGEPVDLRFLERTALPQGKVMLFRSGRDVHIQYAPRALSMSLNLLVYSDNDLRREQFAFDVASGRISDLLAQSGVTNIVALLELVGAMGGDARTCELAEALSMRHPNRNVRLGAARTACALAPLRALEVWERMAADPEPAVAAAARGAAAGIERNGIGR